MKQKQDLANLLFSIDGRGYPNYKSIKGSYSFGDYDLIIDRVQADPYASPSKMHLILPLQRAGFPTELINQREKQIAVSDFLIRSFEKAIQKWGKTKHTKEEGSISIDHCGQEILERTAVLIGNHQLEARFTVNLPAAGRRILGRSAARLLTELLPKIVFQSLFFQNIDSTALKKQTALFLDQEFIRSELEKNNLVAFVANGSILPRENGASNKPLENGVPFLSPEHLAIQLQLPSGQTLSGMAIQAGITLIVGGGYHGKSTLLQALTKGVYNHILGDGREWVITRNNAVKIRAEDGRSVKRVNISPFINNLPGKKDTHDFSTENASGSTSQAAGVIEALEAGSTLLLIDEDTSATNFMIRDGRMQKLIAKEKEPITPFVEKIRPLYEEKDVSTILIAGGSGDYFEAADLVILMDEYIPKDVTQEAKRISQTDGYSRETVSAKHFGHTSSRIPHIESVSWSKKENRMKVKGTHTILYGQETIDLSALEQLVSESQLNSIAAMLEFCKSSILGVNLTIDQLANRLYQQIEQSGLDSIATSGHPGNLALPRKQEFCAALNRYRSLQIKRPTEIENA